jgi:hypothetical protein
LLKWTRRSLVERAAAHFLFEVLHALFVKAVFANYRGKLGSMTLDPLYPDR